MSSWGKKKRKKTKTKKTPKQTHAQLTLTSYGNISLFYHKNTLRVVTQFVN